MAIFWRVSITLALKTLAAFHASVAIHIEEVQMEEAIALHNLEYWYHLSKSTFMNISDRVRWTTADLELLPDNGNRYEIIDGDLFVTKAPHWGHQKATGNIYQELNGFFST